MWRAGMGGREVGGMEWRMDGGMAEPGTAADLQGEALPSFPSHLSLSCRDTEPPDLVCKTKEKIWYVG